MDRRGNATSFLVENPTIGRRGAGPFRDEGIRAETSKEPAAWTFKPASVNPSARVNAIALNKYGRDEKVFMAPTFTDSSS
jgi:hypothetical protein